MRSLEQPQQERFDVVIAQLKQCIVAAGIKLLPDMTNPVEQRGDVLMEARSIMIAVDNIKPETFSDAGWGSFAFMSLQFVSPFRAKGTTATKFDRQTSENRPYVLEHDELECWIIRGWMGEKE